MKYKNDRLILTDCDGVLMNWEYSFLQWMEQRHGMVSTSREYDMAKRFNLTKAEAFRYCVAFNDSAWVEHLPPLRDAIHVVRELHEKHGYVFQMVTSMSDDPHAQALRIKNTQNLFGKTAFVGYEFTSCGGDKNDLLEKYRDSGLTWIEDKPENALLGKELGLDALLVEHPWNTDFGHDIPVHKSWKSIYEYLT